MKNVSLDQNQRLKQKKCKLLKKDYLGVSIDIKNDDSDWFVFLFEMFHSAGMFVWVEVLANFFETKSFSNSFWEIWERLQKLFLTEFVDPENEVAAVVVVVVDVELSENVE